MHLHYIIILSDYCNHVLIYRTVSIFVYPFGKAPIITFDVFLPMFIVLITTLLYLFTMILFVQVNKSGT